MTNVGMKTRRMLLVPLQGNFLVDSWPLLTVDFFHVYTDSCFLVRAGVGRSRVRVGERLKHTEHQGGVAVEPVRTAQVKRPIQQRTCCSQVHL